VDNFSAGPPTALGPQVTVTRLNGTGTVSGKVTFQATVTGGAQKITFLLNGVLQSTATTSPASWTFDSTTVADGTYTLTVRAGDSAGNIGVQTLTLTVSNTSTKPSTPTITLHNPNIGIVELAYQGTPITNSFEQGLLKNNVDLVVSNPGYLSAIHSVAPNTPQLIYNNVSNLYGGLLASWEAYAHANNVDPELAFYHVTQPTPFTGDSGSSQPVDWFWGVYQSTSTGALTDQTSVAHGGAGALDIQLGGAGTYTAVGFIEKFNQINITLAQAPGAGWSGVWQYPTAVDASGAPTAWKTLNLNADDTGALTTSGQITFDPPPDWVPAVLTPGGNQLYYVRLLATSGTAAAAPQILEMLGADYVNANGGATGTIPVFDSAAAGGKDYLTAAEYANRKPGDDAWFAYQSRLFYPFYGQMRFVTNPSSTAVQTWAGIFNEQLLAANPLASGIFLDNSTGNLPFAGTPVAESTATYSQDSGALVGAISKAIAPDFLLANTSGGPNTADAIVSNASGAYEEFLLRPETATWSSVGDTQGLVARRLGQSNNPFLVMDSSAVGGSPTDPRTELATVAFYDLLSVPGRTFLDFFGGDSPSTTWQQHWSAAAEANIGTPLAQMQVLTTGPDPENAALTYKVFSRQYSNGLVLYKPLSYAQGVGAGTLDDSTATTVQLGGNYKVVNADGTLGATVTNVTLRNGEGTVLVKA
jgi:hypothetical protein